MSLSQLRTFVEVYRYRSISEAARLLGLTQPAASQHIASLETQIGRPLFARHARGVRPTVIADDLAANLGDSLDIAEAALAGVRARSAQLAGTVHIAAPSDFMAESLAPRLSCLLMAGLNLRLQTGGKDMLYDMLLSDRIDLAFTASRPEDDRLAFQAIGCEKLVAVAAPQIAAYIVNFDDLAAALEDVPHLAYDLDRPLMRTWLEVNELPLPKKLPVVTAPDLRLLRALACSGAGWSVLPDYLCASPVLAGELAIIEPPVAPIENQFYLVWVRSALRHPRIAHARNILLQALTASLPEDAGDRRAV